MADHLDVPLEDAELLEEVQLVSSLIIAASENDGQLGTVDIDLLLGVRHVAAMSGPVPSRPDLRS